MTSSTWWSEHRRHVGRGYHSFQSCRVWVFVQILVGSDSGFWSQIQSKKTLQILDSGSQRVDQNRQKCAFAAIDFAFQILLDSVNGKAESEVPLEGTDLTFVECKGLARVGRRR